MNWRHCWAAIAILTLLEPISASAQKALLPNGSMTAGSDMPEGWRAASKEEGPGAATGARDAAVHKEGPASLRLTVQGDAQGSVTCPLPGLAGKDLAIAGWMRAEGDLSSALLAVVSPNGEPAFSPLNLVFATGQWTPFRVRLSVPSTALEPFLLLQAKGAGSVWLDELSVLPGEEYKAAPVLTEFQGPPSFSFLSWQNRFRTSEKGLALEAPSCQGGAGFPMYTDLGAFVSRTPTLTVTAGEGNEARALRLAVHDADGTVLEFEFPLENLVAGKAVRVTAKDGASISEPAKVSEAGKTPGFDAMRVVQMVLTGDWSSNPVRLALHRLEMAEATPELLAAREAMKQRLAEEEQRKQEAEAKKAARIAELLKAAPHPEDGPEIQHVAAVAPDVLCLVIQEKTFAPEPQVPYEATPGDEIKRSGDHPVLVLENGKVQESLPEVEVFRQNNKRAERLGNLAVNAEAIKPEDAASGAELAAETVDLPQAYRIVGTDDPTWKEPLAPVSVSWKRKPNSPRGVAHLVHVFLRLPRPLVEGGSYRVEFPGVNFKQASVAYRHQSRAVLSPAVHASAIGFRPDDPLKRAYVSTWLGTGGALEYPERLTFELLDEATGKAVYRGEARKVLSAGAGESFKQSRNYSKTDVLALDFGEFTKPGRYRIHVEGLGCSYPFPIAQDVWTQAFQLSMKGLLQHRSGIELGPPLVDLRRPRPMHPGDGATIFASAGSELEGGSQDGIFEMLAKKRTDRVMKDAWGGHMDAGDWDRNSKHPAAMWHLVHLFELFPKDFSELKLSLPSAEASNTIPDILDEVLWNLELHRRLQTEEGGISGGVESTSHPRAGEASWQESLVISAFAPDPRASFIYTATAAKLARNLRSIDAKLAAAYAASAGKAWSWAVSNADSFLKQVPEASVALTSEEFKHQRNLAALELWLLTGEEVFHEDFAATTILGTADSEFMKQHKAMITYARLAEGKCDARLREDARQRILQAADLALEFAKGNAFGITTSIPQLPPMGFVGYLSTPEMIGAVLPHAYLLTGDSKYLAGAVGACLFSAGANPDNQALTTGLGPNHVRFPLHVDSRVTGHEAPAGITVYGPSDPAENYDFDGWAHTWLLQKMVPPSRTWPMNESYWDIYAVPSTNEYTIHQTIIPTAFYWGFLGARK